jgi:23S rRNA G2069 N7-methylase RlmK/C1962 C5-methylase RlmI
MLSMDEFVGVIKKSASISKKLVKIFKKTGASIDHPFSVNYPEGEYLKVIWSVAD